MLQLKPRVPAELPGLARGLAIDGWRPTTAQPPPASAGVHRLARTSPPGRAGPMEINSI